MLCLMRFVLALVAFAACDFPTPSEEYACRVTPDCETGRVCEGGYCVIGNAGGGVDASKTPTDASVGGADAAAMPDANNFPAQLAMCMSSGYDPASNGKYYRLPPNPANWNTAEADCANDVVGATHLIVLTDTAEVQIASTEPGWVGLSDQVTEGTFVNVTNETPDQRPWDSGQPDNGGNEDCARIQSNGTLDDDQCTNIRYYACECDGRAPL
jgi:hypothetical protein